SLGALFMLVAPPVFSRDPSFPYSPNETGGYVAVEQLAPPLSIGRTHVPSEMRDVSWGRGTRDIPTMIFPYSPNETGEHTGRPLP
ncbi:MAG TPA: hypothetical protein VFB75_11340, partial [Burkholderiales bacterium]|nr:hypothetical protein [Burkholderiales bacterium]